MLPGGVDAAAAVHRPSVAGVVVAVTVTVKAAVWTLPARPSPSGSPSSTTGTLPDAGRQLAPARPLPASRRSAADRSRSPGRVRRRGLIGRDGERGGVRSTLMPAIVAVATFRAVARRLRRRPAPSADRTMWAGGCLGQAGTDIAALEARRSCRAVPRPPHPIEAWIDCPMGFLPGKWRSAKVLLMTATQGAPARSRGSTPRPFRTRPATFSKAWSSTSVKSITSRTPS